MTILIEGFKIGAEFAFDAGLASAEIGAIQNKIGSLSNSIDNLMYQAQNFGLNFVASFTGVGGGILGVLGNAISASDEFKKAQLSFSNIIVSNIDNFSGSVNTFNERMAVSKGIINDVIADARRFSIPAKELLKTTEIIGGLTAPIGLTGKNFDISRSLSANYLKASRYMGVDPSQSMNQFIGIATGQATEQGLMGKRLFKEVGIEDTQGNIIRTSKAWNKFFESDKLNAIVALNKAMDKFTKNADELEGATNTIGALFQRVKDLFTGFASILRPLGDVILPMVVKYVNMVIKVIENQGGNIVKDLARFIEPITKAPEQFLVKMLSLRHLAADVAKAAWWTSSALALAHLESVISLLGRTALGAKIGSIATEIPYLGKFFTWIVSIAKSIGSLLGTGGGFLTLIGRLSFLFGFLTIVFQGISRAVEQLRIDKIIELIKNSDVIANRFTRISAALIEIFRPIDILIDLVSALVYPILRFASGIDNVTGGLNVLTRILEGVSWVVRNITGVFMAVFTLFNEIVIFFIVNPLNQVIDAFKYLGSIITDFLGSILPSLPSLSSATGEGSKSFMGYDGSMLDQMKNTWYGDVIKKMESAYNEYSRPYLSPDQEGKEKAIAQNNVNIGKVDIINQIKHEVQPDRIAFTVAEQLMKLGNNSKSANTTRGTLKGQLAR